MHACLPALCLSVWQAWRGDFTQPQLSSHAFACHDTLQGCAPIDHTVAVVGPLAATVQVCTCPPAELTFCSYPTLPTRLRLAMPLLRCV